MKVIKLQSSLVPVEDVLALIHLARGQRVILDSDLARLYGVPTFRFNEAVKRNIDRFPEDFMFRLTNTEWQSLTSQIAILKKGRGQHRKYTPHAFTEYGALMAANILNSPRAITVSVCVIRAFVQYRQALANHADLAQKLAALEKKYDSQFKVVFQAIRQLMSPEQKPKREIGYHTIKK